MAKRNESPRKEAMGALRANRRQLESGNVP